MCVARNRESRIYSTVLLLTIRGNPVDSNVTAAETGPERASAVAFSVTVRDIEDPEF